LKVSKSGKKSSNWVIFSIIKS